jgi:Tripartite tricarboxylate transporter TctB family
LKIKSEKDFWSGIMFLVVGIGFAVGATNYSMGSAARPGAGYFPLILSTILAILGAIVLFKSLTIETEGGGRIGSIAWRPLSIVVGSIVLFGFMLPRLGLVITVPVLIAIVSFAGDEFKWRGVIIAAAVLTVFSWAVFVWGLGLTIPLWPAFLAS